MDFFNKALSSATKSAEQPNNESDSQAQLQPKKHSTAELFASAKVVAGAAQDTFGNKSDTIDKGKVAGAAGDLLGGAKEYGKLEEDKGLGKYVGQAETYLHSYGSSGQKTVTKVDGDAPPATAAAAADGGGVVAEAEEKKAVDEDKKVVEEDKKVVEEEKKGVAGGAGDYFKLAEGLLK